LKKASNHKVSYALKITPDEDGGFNIEVPDLPGCVTFAENWDDIPNQVREAISSWVGSALKHGDPVPQPSAIPG
jgi:predicted RNase H-like HicB family nuclease